MESRLIVVGPVALVSACVVANPLYEPSGGAGTGDGTTTGSSVSGTTGPTPTEGSGSGSKGATSTSTDTGATDEGSSSHGSHSTTDAPDESSTGTGATTGGSSLCDFVDDFERPNSNELGNGWIEKNPTSVRLQDGRVGYESSGEAYFNSVWYRPLDAVCDDIEVSLEVNFTSAMNPGFPQVMARIQPDNVGQAGRLDAYICFLQNGEQLRVRRSRFVEGPSELDIVPLPLLPNTEDDYRLRMRIEGADPVAIDCVWEIRTGMEWDVIEAISLMDDAPERIAEPGTFGASTNNSPVLYTYDNYRATDLR